MDLSGVEQAAASAAGTRDERLRGQALRRRRDGVVHTPPQLARFLVSAVDELLKPVVEGGIADPRVTLVDPACGTGAFLAAALAVAGDRRTAPGRVVAIDRDPEALLDAEFALGRDMARARWPVTLRCSDTLADEGLLEDILVDSPVIAIVGNPPWAAGSHGVLSASMRARLEDFRTDASGQRLPERKLGVLSDAYVCFWRWACELATRASSHAVVGLITNGSFLDGPVHRGMRGSMRSWFDSIDVIDLGGNAMLARDPGPDGNVFGVRPSVAMTLASRAAPGSVAPAPMRHARLVGSAPDKLGQLADAALSDIPLVPFEPLAPLDRFVPTARAAGAYDSWPALWEVIPFHREGVQSNRDSVVMARDRGQLLDRLRDFAGGGRTGVLLDASKPLAHYDPDRARAAVRAALDIDPEGDRGISVRPIAYRPMESHWFAPLSPLCHRPRPALLRAVDASTFSLVTVRKDRGSAPWRHISVTRHVPDGCYLSARSSCRTRAFPTHDEGGNPNLDGVFVATLSERLGIEFEVEALFDYVLAVLSTPVYQERFDEPLRLDYPRLPPPPDAETFVRICEHGRALRALLCNPEAAGPSEPEELRIGHIRVSASAGINATLGQLDRVVAPLLT